MSQRKAKEYRQAMEQYRGVVVDVDDLKRRIGAMEARHRREDKLEEIRRHECEYHVIEIMACPGGCIGGGGQPLHHGRAEVLKARAEAIYREDEGKPIRKSHENPYIQQLYEECLGKPLSERAHHLLHTHYFNKSN